MGRTNRVGRTSPLAAPRACRVRERDRFMVRIACIFTFVSMIGFAQAAEPNGDKYWPQWRGPNANGVAPLGKPPLEWSDTKNVRWKVAIPGRGDASPIVWGDRVYVQTAIRVDRNSLRDASKSGGGEPPKPWRGYGVPGDWRQHVDRG